MFLNKRIVYWLLVASKGGQSRIDILRLLQKQPCNLNQISLALGFDYKTVQHHIGLLFKHQLVEASGNSYGKIYFISKDMEAIMGEFQNYTGREK